MAAATPVKPSTSGTLGDVAYQLSDLNRQNDDFIVQQSKTSPNIGQDEYIKAARAASIALNNMRHACEHQNTMSLPFENVTAPLRDQLGELIEIVTLLQTKPKDTIQSLIERAQRFTSTLKLAGWQPQLGEMTPFVYVVDGCFDLVVPGVFDHAARTKKFTLTLLNCTAEQKESKPDALSFKVSASTDFFPESAKLNYHLFKVRVEVDYKGWTSIYQAKFEPWVITYPLNLGLQSTCIQKTVKEILKRPFRSATFKLHRRDFKDGKEVTRQQTIWPSEGWKIADQVKLFSNSKTASKGNQFPNNSAVITLTLHKEVTEKVWAYVEFEEYQEVMEEKGIKSSLSLPWGKSSDFKAERFQLTFTHQGVPYTITQLCEPNNFLKVEKTGDNTYKITATVPQ